MPSEEFEALEPTPYADLTDLAIQAVTPGSRRGT